MALELSQYKLPISWQIDGTECKGLTLTQISALDDGMYQLIALERWAAKKSNLDWLAGVIHNAFQQPHVKVEYEAAVERYRTRGKKIGKARAVGRRIEYESQQRQVEYGLFS